MPRLYAKLREISKCSVILAALPASAQGCYEGTRAVGVDGEEPLPAWPTGGQPSPGDPPSALVAKSRCATHVIPVAQR